MGCSGPELIDRPSNHIISSQTTDAIVFGDRHNHFTQEIRTTPGRNEAAYRIEREQIRNSMLTHPEDFPGIRQFAYALSHLEGTRRDYAAAFEIFKNLYERLGKEKFDPSLESQIEKFKNRVRLYGQCCGLFQSVIEINSANKKCRLVECKDEKEQDSLLFDVGGFELGKDGALYVRDNTSLAELYVTRKATLEAALLSEYIQKKNPEWTSRALELLARKEMEHLQAVYENIGRISRNQYQWFAQKKLPSDVSVYNAMASYAQAMVQTMIKNHGGERFLAALEGVARIDQVGGRISQLEDIGCHYVEGKLKDSQFLEELLCKQGELYERLADIYKRRFRFHGEYDENQYRGLLNQALIWFYTAEKKSRGRDGFNAAHRDYLRVQEKLERAE
ncbi:hypothetical protein GF371_03135 [Candidatus Woesearchaeota archaeon]|nr:hypothetical protein [Candidatus Woesearchaeota archaeon]